MLHEAVNSINRQQPPDQVCRLVVTETHTADLYPNLFLAKRWLPLLLLISRVPGNSSLFQLRVWPDVERMEDSSQHYQLHYMVLTHAALILETIVPPNPIT